MSGPPRFALRWMALAVALAGVSSPVRATVCVIQQGEFALTRAEQANRKRAYHRNLKKCGRFHPAACYRAALLNTGQTGYEKSDPTELLRISCARGYVPACLEVEVRRFGGESCRRASLGMEIPFKQNPDLLAMYKVLEPRLRSGCERGNSAACLYAADFFVWSGEAPEAFAARRRQWLARACRLGDAAGCHRLGLAQIEGGAEDPAPALLEAGRLGDSDAHRALADFLAIRGDPAALKTAVGQYEIACERGVPTACAKLGALYDAGRGVAADSRKAVEYFQRECRDPDTEGCFALGEHARDGAGMAPDPGAAYHAFRLACRYLPRGCVEAGRLMEDGKVPEDEPDASRTQIAAGLYERGCDSHLPEACYRFVRLFYSSSHWRSEFEHTNAMDWTCHSYGGEGVKWCYELARWLAEGENRKQLYAKRIAEYMAHACRNSTPQDDFHAAACAHDPGSPAPSGDSR